HPFGLGLGFGDDRFGFALGLALLALVFGEEPLCLLPQAPRLVEFGLDADAALVERVEDLLVGAGIEQHAEEKHEGDRDPEFRLFDRFHRPASYRLSASATAASTVLPVGVVPTSRCTMVAAVSTA